MIDEIRIMQLIKEGKLRKRAADKRRIASLVQSSLETANFVKGMHLTEESSTVIFRELYECIRQIGDALWWANGYEVTGSHEVSMEILEEADIKDKTKLLKLDWFRRTRNSANYRGYRIGIEQAKEILEFWECCGKELIIEAKKRSG